MTETPNYWANLPANVRYSDKINPMERLLYAEITALSNYKGYCWASNKYFGKIFKKHPNSISRNLSKLALHKFIKIQIVKTGNHVESRRISIADNPKQNCEVPINKNVKYNNKKEKELLFEEFWNNYNYKKSKDIKFKKHPATWLNQGCWDDEFEQSNNDKMVY